MAETGIAEAHVTGDRLTKREREILSHISDGSSSKEVARTLYCSRRTVEYHLFHIYRKLGVNNRLQALRLTGAVGSSGPSPESVS